MLSEELIASNNDDHKHHYESRVKTVSTNSYSHQSTSITPPPYLLQRSRITFDSLLTPLHKTKDINKEKKRATLASYQNCRATTSNIINSIEQNGDDIKENTSNNSWLVLRNEDSFQNEKDINIKYAKPIHLPLHTIVTDILSTDIMSLPNMSPAQTCDVNISMALTYLSRSMFESAIVRLNESIRRHPYSFLPNFIRGICHYRLSNFLKAKIDFTVCCNCFHKATASTTNYDRMERKDYDKALAFFNRSLVWMKMNNTEKAMNDINQAIEIYGKEKLFFSNRALLFRKKGNFEAAQYDYRTMRRMEADEKTKIEMDENTIPLKRNLTQITTKVRNNLLNEQGGQNRGIVRRKTIIRRHALTGNKSPGSKRARSELDLKTNLYGQVYSALTCPPHKRTKTQLDVLVKESRMMSAFSHLDGVQLKTLWQFLEYRSVPSNTRLFEEGDVAEDYMLLWSGSVSARVEMKNSIIRHSNNVAKALAMEREITINIMKAGEAIMLEDGVRKASCVTEEPSEILFLKKEHFHQTFHVFLQKSHDEKVEFLSAFDFLSHWDKGKLGELAHLCREKRYHRGETVIVQGDQSNSIFFVKTGMLSLKRKLPNPESDSSSGSRTKTIQHHVATLSSGDIFGEATILDSTRETVFETSCYSETLSICYRLDRIQLDMSHWDEETKNKLMERSIKIQDDSVLLRSQEVQKKFKKRSALIVSKARNLITKKKNINKRYIR